MDEPLRAAPLLEEIFRTALADLVEAISLSDFGYEDFILQSLYRAQALLRATEPVCEHDWIDIRNNFIESGEMCVKCNGIRAGNTTTSSSAAATPQAAPPKLKD